MACLSAIGPIKLIIISAVIAIIITDCRGADELNVLGNTIVAIGGLILAAAAQQEFIGKKGEQKAAKEDIMRQIENLMEKYKSCSRT